MEAKKIKEIMIPVESYATVNQESSIYDALIAIRKSQEKLSPGTQQIRAVLVVDDNNNIVGKMGHAAFLRALEPKYNKIIDFEKLTRAGVSAEFISSMTDNLRLWQDDFVSICRQAGIIKVKDVMSPVSEGIDENASITEAIHQIIVLQLLSLLVKRGSNVIGIVRLSDLFHEVERNIINEHQKVNK
jgi:CBS domain-containing protein